MLSDPLTPPQQCSADGNAKVDGNVLLAPPSNEYLHQQLATPMSIASMGSGVQERSNGEDDSNFYDISDDEQDTSRGSAHFLMSNLDEQQLQPELKTMNAGIVGPDDITGLFMDGDQTSSGSHTHFEEYLSNSEGEDMEPDSNDGTQHPEDLEGHDLGNLQVPETMQDFNSQLPTTMSAVSLQLQQMQDDEGHVDFIGEDGVHIDNNNMEDQYNFTLGDFLHEWGASIPEPEASRSRVRRPVLSAVHQQRYEIPMPMQRSDLQGERCDIQRINWEAIGVTRLEARQKRRQSYRNYTNMRLPLAEQEREHPRKHGRILDDDQNFFRFRRMDFNHNIHLSHFQLRNLVACASRDHVFYAGKSKVMQWNPNNRGVGPTTAMDLTNPEVQPTFPYSGGVQISTITVAENILVAGGFHGEYAIQNLGSHKDSKHMEGMITDHVNSITNHVQVHQSRTSTSPVAVFASNDTGVRLLDIETNTFIAEHRYEPAINCTAISPDQRLRVLVGDTHNVMICRSDTGEILQTLDGHRDFGFACDWADDGWTIATGNQDMQIMIWDARMWTDSSGRGRPIATIAAEMAGVRKLKFSPLGSGKRLLIAAEPADFINVINGDLFNDKQILSFFGEIGGLDFTNNGQDLIVANTDSMRGGLMEFERCNLGGRGIYSLNTFRQPAHRQKRQRRPYKDEESYDWKVTDEDVVRHSKSRGNLQQRQAEAADLGSKIGYF